jgi:hypothetical protein
MNYKGHYNHKLSNTEKGSVLWFILIAVALIGILTVVLSRSSDRVNQSGNFEHARIKITQMMRFVQGIEAAIQQMKLNGVSESDISFEFNGTNVNGNCTSNACKIFHVEGAGLNAQTPPAGLSSSSNWVFTGGNDVAGIGTSGQADLIVILQNIDADFCAQINKDNGQTYAVDTGVDFSSFAGSFAVVETLENAAGKKSGCLAFDNAGTEEPFFYYVLLAR